MIKMAIKEKIWYFEKWRKINKILSRLRIMFKKH